MNELFGLQGRVEIILEDQDGNVKYREETKNTVTDAFKNYTVYNHFSQTALAGLLKSTPGTTYNATANSYNQITPVVPTGAADLGIYTLTQPINVKGNTFAPPYVDISKKILNKDVLFYSLGNVAFGADEGAIGLIPYQGGCYYDTVNKELNVEYRRNGGSGTIAAVCIGRAHTLPKVTYIISARDQKAPSDWFSANLQPGYLIEHTKTNGTIIYKVDNATAASANIITFNCKTKEYKNNGLNTNSATNILNATNNSAGGLIVGNSIFKVVRTAVSGTNYPLVINEIKNWTTATTLSTKAITIPTNGGMTADTINTPVLVYNTETGKLEIFVSISKGRHVYDEIDAWGYNTVKVIVDPANLDDYEIVDLGVGPYAVSNYTSGTAMATLTAFLNHTGTYHDGKYYLPIAYAQDETTNYALLDSAVSANNGWHDGMIIDKDFKVIEDFFCYRSQTATANVSRTYVVVITDEGPLPCSVASISSGDLGSPYVSYSQVISGVNLAEPVAKGNNDILRLIYHYKMA